MLPKIAGVRKLFLPDPKIYFAYSNLTTDKCHSGICIADFANDFYSVKRIPDDWDGSPLFEYPEESDDAFYLGTRSWQWNDFIYTVLKDWYSKECCICSLCDYCPELRWSFHEKSGKYQRIHVCVPKESLSIFNKAYFL